MSVELVNGHVLFPHGANYAESPRWSRQWDNEIADAEFGNESRFALRSVSRQSISWKVCAHDLQDDARLLNRILAAKKSGLACAPFWGRGSELAATVLAATVELEIGYWPFAIGDQIILLDPSGNFEVKELVNVVGRTLTIDAPVAGQYLAGSLVWPLLFGRFACENFEAFRTEIGACNLTIKQLVSPEAQTLGVAGPPIDGIGGRIIEDTFIVQ